MTGHRETVAWAALGPVTAPGVRAGYQRAVGTVRAAWGAVRATSMVVAGHCQTRRVRQGQWTVGSVIVVTEVGR